MNLYVNLFLKLFPKRCVNQWCLLNVFLDWQKLPFSTVAVGSVLVLSLLLEVSTVSSENTYRLYVIVSVKTKNDGVDRRK